MPKDVIVVVPVTWTVLPVVDQISVVAAEATSEPSAKFFAAVKLCAVSVVTGLMTALLIRKPLAAAMTKTSIA